MDVSKAWDWQKNQDAFWNDPCEESYYFKSRWQSQGFRDLLDYGCGLGRHALFFAREGFRVSAFDLSRDAVDALTCAAEAENLHIAVNSADMLHLPYADRSFDCIFAYNVISHTDTVGARAAFSEIARVLCPEGEIFCTLCAKDAWSFSDAGYPRLDENTVVKTDDGPEKDVPHFYVNLDDIFPLMEGFEVLRVRHVDQCYIEGARPRGRHYFILARRLAE